MANILYLVHRLPYPPNKGDKVRSYHLLQHLLQDHQVFLGTFVDDVEDMDHVPHVSGLCASMHVARLNPRWARILSLRALLERRSLTERYYFDRTLANWVRGLIDRGEVDAAVVFSSSMAQYVLPGKLPMLVDFVDVDSAKWTDYGAAHRWPLSWLYRREGRHLLAFERTAARASRRSFFVTERETELFCRLAPDCRALVEAMGNGVDAEYFSPDHAFESPFAENGVAVVFTGAMDYWPNIDAVTWFAKDMLPALRRNRPTLRFYIVGRSPTPAVQALAGPAVVVTGTVPDVRPYLACASVIVAPLRLARGIQNKVLEAMAMARPVVASQCCLEPIDARPGQDIVGAASAKDFIEAVAYLLDDIPAAEAIGQCARRQVLRRYSWQANLAGLDRHLEQAARQGERRLATGIGA